MCRLKLHRTDVAESLMQPLSIIEHLDELKHVRLDFLSRMILPLVHQLILERTEETLYDRIVVTVPFAAHAGDQPGLRQLSLVRHTGVCGALIGVMDESGPRALKITGDSLTRWQFSIRRAEESIRGRAN